MGLIKTDRQTNRQTDRQTDRQTEKSLKTDKTAQLARRRDVQLSSSSSMVFPDVIMNRYILVLCNADDNVPTYVIAYRYICSTRAIP